MNKVLVLTAILIGITACATSEPDSRKAAAIAAAPAHASEAIHAEGSIETTDFMRASAAPDIAGENSIYCRKKKLASSRRMQGVCMTPAE